MKKVICDCNIIHEEVVKNALNDKPNDSEFKDLSSLFKILGDETRIKMLWLLDSHEMCVCDIANVLNMTKSAISHQLSTLKSCGVVKYNRIGKEIYYQLDDEHISRLYEVGIEHIKHKEKEGK